ncbi:MAG TPA: glycoside hydrolase family 15 protein, partial [Candidatus Binataceae bacterium]|nr:glycoside hydrolase family 15 protein [Candidatus Binataceae bacterium]
MSLKIEDYAIIGNTCTVALVGIDGSIDWLCVPRFDSPACFASLLGTEKNGRWRIAPKGEVRRTTRKYRGDTLVLETQFETADGIVALIDFMPIHERLKQVDMVRIVEGRAGHVPMHMEAIFRFDYGQVVPWVTSRDDGLRAIAGPDAVKLRTSVAMRGEDFTTTSDFTVARGQQIPFTLTYYPSHEDEPSGRHPMRMLERTEAWWRDWSGRSKVGDPYRDAIMRSLITLKALTYGPTGGIVAAATSSLPEKLGGERNWDYRMCWLRDSTFTLYALAIAGYHEEAKAWRQWLLRAIAGEPARMQIMYGLRGERRLTELEVPWLKGYADSKPVRIGNAAHQQFQLDVYGEVMDSFYTARKEGLEPEAEAAAVETALMEFLETAWKEPDEGIWEVRGKRRHFTHSKIMAWVAADRAVKLIEKFGNPGPVERWRKLREEIRADVLARGFDPGRNAFVQSYGSDLLDASLLMIPLIGFLPAKDPRMTGTVAAIERELIRDGLVRRYQNREEVDGLPPGEGTFLACTFWYADNLALMGRHD